MFNNLTDPTSVYDICTNGRITFTPLEAAILWAHSDTTLTERQIFNIINIIRKKEEGSHPHIPWNKIHFFCNLIHDAMIHQELPFKSDSSPTVIDICSPDILIRYIELKKWINKTYPEHKPSFLFSESEKRKANHISQEDLFILLTERETLKIRVENYSNQINQLEETCTDLEKNLNKSKRQHHDIHPRSENTYLSIISCLLWIILKKTNHPSFPTIESIVDVILTEFDGRPGLGERNLRGKLAKAQQTIPLK